MDKNSQQPDDAGTKGKKPAEEIATTVTTTTTTTTRRIITHNIDDVIKEDGLTIDSD